MDISKLKQSVDKHILVLGDIMIDRYVEGRVDRMSPEAPVPVLVEENTFDRLGGAANVAFNLKSLGFTVTLIGIVGDDQAAGIMQQILDQNGIYNVLIKDATRKTTVKQRYLSKGQQLLRLDKEDIHPIADDIIAQIISQIDVEIKKSVDGVVLSDYDKGFFTEKMICSVVDTCKFNAIPTYADPKHRNFWYYKNVTFFKPNKHELDAATGRDVLKQQLSSVYEQLNCEYLICTMASEGMAYFDGRRHDVIPTQSIDIVDVSGAGDTALAALVLSHQYDFDIEDICHVSNAASRVICQKNGVSTLTQEELIFELKEK